MAEEQWRGIEAAELEKNRDKVPPRPDAQQSVTAQGLEGTFASVHFTGNYGAFCGQYQEETAKDISREAAQEEAWALYGMCKHQITYYDDDGKVVMQE